jgi:alpha-methylacyl-CoA racemase
VCLERNPRLVFGRMTGWGQDGPYSQAAGHDINYIALAGVLEHLGRAGEQPTPPINLIGDFGGGGMLLAYGVVCGILSAKTTGTGQVVDAAMVDGSASLMMMTWAFKAMGIFDEHARGTNILDTGAHFYDTYECADGRYVAIGAIEPQFYAELVGHLGLDLAQLPAQMDKNVWSELKEQFATIFRTKTRDEWCALLEGTDACFAPVLSMQEATRHPHNVHRQTFTEVAGVPQPAPAPRFSATPGAISRPPSHAGQHTDEILADWLGLDADAAADRRSSGAVA